MSNVALDAAYGPRLRKNAGAWQVFLAAVSFATLFPFAAIPYTEHVIPDTTSALGVFFILNFVGSNFHVAATGWFYTDPAMRAHFRARPLRYLAIPALLVIGSAVLFQAASMSQRSYLLAAFISWQLWHYQKQNVGLLSFIAAGSDGKPLSQWERRTLMMAAISGILGYFSVSEFGQSGLAHQLAWLHRAGGAIYLALPVALAITIIKTPALRTNPLRLAFLLIGSAFFLPTFIFGDQHSALVGYAVAHGLQYLVFMGVVSVGRPRPGMSMVLLLAIATLGAVLLNKMATAGEASYGFALYGAFLGVVMAHFVLDAGIWRLREPFQRGYMRERFRFVFER
jgi:hypothetical protein